MPRTNRNSELNPVQRVALELLWAFAWLVAVSPRWFKFYILETLVCVVLRDLLRYRRRVIDDNLRRSFPEKSESERAQIRRRYYLILAEMAICTLNMAHMPRRKAMRSLQMIDPERCRRELKGRNWIGLMAHFGCWEYSSYWGYYEPSQLVVAVYHPLTNPVIDAFYGRLRRYENAQPVPMEECLRFYLRHRDEGIGGKNLVLGLIADQNPPRRPDSHWFRFLNQDTIFFDGGEKLARKCRLPVYFAKTGRTGRGRYTMSFEEIYDGSEPVADNEITERYVRRLEAMICERPELWMWSHRRWKHKRET